ncbi:hypothetical protein [Cupriavidus sp. YR651]|uniref:hypothetical protein n=1 Tax=Cupriavidus sp. YR651 TaxID=1855315 RepID=UPI0015A426BC|nr:hypothetical protein [Cupriavidus sp. YR651]
MAIVYRPGPAIAGLSAACCGAMATAASLLPDAATLLPPGVAGCSRGPQAASRNIDKYDAWNAAKRISSSLIWPATIKFGETHTALLSHQTQIFSDYTPFFVETFRNGEAPGSASPCDMAVDKYQVDHSQDRPADTARPAIRRFP